MQTKHQDRPDLLLLLSLLLAILLTPVLDRDGWRRLVLAGVMFITVVLSTVRLLQIKRWVWPSVLLASVNVIFVLAGNTFRNQTLTGIRWAFLAAFFALTAAGLFSYLSNSLNVTQAHLYTAVNIYLLLGLVWTTLYLVPISSDLCRIWQNLQRAGADNAGMMWRFLSLSPRAMTCLPKAVR